MAYSKISGVQIKAMATTLPAAYRNLFPTLPFNTQSGSSEEDLADNMQYQTTSDLGYKAAIQLIEHKSISVSDIGILLFVSRTYDYRGPVTAAVLQHRLQIPTDCIAFDIPHGATALVSGLLLAASQLKACNKSLALVIVGDTTDKLVPEKKIGNIPTHNAAAAFLLSKGTEEDCIEGEMMSFSDYFTDIIFPGGGFRLKDKGPVEKRIFGINFEDPARLLINETVLRQFILQRVPEFWHSSMIGSDWASHNTNDILVQFNDLHLESIEVYPQHSMKSSSDLGSFGAAALPLILDLNRRGVSIPFAVAALYVGEGFSTGIFKCMITEDSIVPTVFTNSAFEGAWTPADY